MRSAVLLVAVTAALVPLAAQAPPTAETLVARLQARYDTVRDFSADFTQTTRSSLLPQMSVEYGQVQVKKPGRMRWTYREPQEKVAGADGTDFYVYVKDDRLVTYTPLPEPGEASTAMLFLAGLGNLTRDFSAHVPPEQPEDEWHLLLTPHAAQDDYEVLTLMVDRGSLALTGVETTDAQGGRSTIRFANYRENTGLGDGLFVFTPPRGVEIIRR
jgi:outer membrane lipoprotein carrier protein